MPEKKPLHYNRETPSEKRKVVLGLGSTLCRDDGIGVYVLQSLQNQFGDKKDIEWVDGGVLGLNLLPLVESCSHLLVLDAIDAGQIPGTLIEMDQEELQPFIGIKMSEHQVSFQEVLALTSFRGTRPTNLSLLGIQPEDLSLGLEMSSKVAGAAPIMATRAVEILHDWKLIDL